MSRHADQQHRYQRQLVQAARSLHSRVEAFKLTHEEYLDRRDKRIFQTSAWKNSTGYTRAYVRGVMDQLWQDHYRLLAWGFVVDGQIMTTDEMCERWPNTWFTRCTSGTKDEPGNGTHFYPADDPGDRRPF